MPQTEQERVTMRLWPEAGNRLGLSRGATYAAAQRGEIPTVRVGNLILVPIRPFEEKFGGRTA